MLSILIPIYNFSCVDLVKGLHDQCNAMDIAFEIIALEDASTLFLEENGILGQLSNSVVYERLTQNIGRSRIRNRLAERAKYDYLLFMDCDSALVRADYIARYVQFVQPDQLLYGGRVYRDLPPENKEFQLHWKFGKNREQISTKQRAKQPYHSFMTNNFVIPKAIFQRVEFDENLTQYGHEDTLFGLELQQHRISILHLDNPLEHIGLESNELFLQKTEKALENLAQLYKEGKKIETKLLRFYKKIDRWKLSKLVGFTFRIFRPFLKKLLLLRNPSLFLFDGYKLGVFVSKM